ncbi:P-loop NTPase fold protein [Vogesella sp. AC12]|uniref:KAP family P-loop NTPase fold protein n=1 Tax=Vogesella sp. AC12 TaxID=2950550 RepID=UPI002109B71F|nr:P-loop NTPase fold protein [Vogesella sp. AC12]MCQ4142955.1 KAP family NTPase [Vogesella sp. AC12]
MSIENSIENAKYNEWFKDYQWKDCKLDREEHGKFLANYLASEKHGLVLNLDGSWGTGKTDFLRRMYVHLLQQGHPVIYIDAWESDFSREPLMVVASELLRQLQNLNQNIGNEEAYQKVAAKFAGFLKGAVIFGSSALTKKFFGDPEMGKIFAEQTMGHVSHESMLTLSQLHSEQVDAIKMIRQELSGLAEVLQTNFSYKIPVVVLIDELDRCRSDYSIEMLEVIKHFFNTDNFVFMVASDTFELCKSISVVYGSNFSSEKYLRRFFSRTARLEKPDVPSFVQGMFDDISSGIHLVSTDPLSTGIGLEFIFSRLCLERDQNIGLRDVEQIAVKLKAVYAQASAYGKVEGEIQYVNFTVLAMGLIWHHFDHSGFGFGSGSYSMKSSEPIFDSFVMHELLSICLTMVTYDFRLYENIGDTLIDRFRTLIQRKPSAANIGKLYSDFSDFLRGVNFRGTHAEARYIVDSGKWWMLDDYQNVITLSGSLK